MAGKTRLCYIVSMSKESKSKERVDEALSPRNRGKFLFAAAAFQTELFRAMAGYIPAFTNWTLRLELPAVVFHDARRVQEIRERCVELGVGRTAPHASRRTPAFELIELLCEAPEAGVFFRAVFGLVKPALKEVLEAHLHDELKVFDAPSVPVVEACLRELGRQIEWARDFDEHGTAVDEAWWERLQAYGKGLGEALANGGDPRAPVQTEARRIGVLPLLQSVVPEGFREGVADPALADSTDYADRALYHAHNFFMELQASDSCASLLFEAPDMPWDFYRDTARHMWDESRHCAFGTLKLKDLGRDIREAGISGIVYATRQTLDPLDRYAALTTQEEDAFPGKHAGLKDALEHGDAVLARAWSYDISDESQHVRYGRSWIPVMIEETGEPRSFDEVRRDATNWRRDVLSERYANARAAFAKKGSRGLGRTKNDES